MMMMMIMDDDDDDHGWWLMMDDDGWWWMMMVDDGWWWLLMDDDGCWWMMMVDDGWWWMMMMMMMTTIKTYWVSSSSFHPCLCERTSTGLTFFRQPPRPLRDLRLVRHVAIPAELRKGIWSLSCPKKDRSAECQHYVCHMGVSMESNSWMVFVGKILQRMMTGGGPILRNHQINMSTYSQCIEMYRV